MLKPNMHKKALPISRGYSSKIHRLGRAPKDEAKDESWRHDAALKLFDHIESQVRLADQKAGLIFTADSVLLAGYISLFNSGLAGQVHWLLRSMILLSSGIAAIAVLIAILFVLSSINPVSKTSPYDQYQVFFKQIADPEQNKNSLDYRNNFFKLSREEFTGQVLGSIHGKSDWASKKLSQINFAVRFTIFSVVAAAVAGALAFLSRVLLVRVQAVAEMVV